VGRMHIRSRFLIWVNGALLVLWALYVGVAEVSEWRWMLGLEVRNLRSIAGQVRALGFAGTRPLPGIQEVVRVMAGQSVGTEVMVIGPGSRVIASSVGGRVGHPWYENDIWKVLRGEALFVKKVHGHRHWEIPVLDVTLAVTGRSGQAPLAIHVARRLAAVNAKLRAQRWTQVTWAAVSMLIMGLLLSLVSHRWLLRPLGAVMDTLAGSRWFEPLEPRGDELDRLGATVRQMVSDADAAVDERDGLVRQVRSFNRELEARIAQVKAQLTETQAELVEKERLSAVGELAAGLAHELRTPMHIVRAAAELLEDREENREACRDIFGEVDRVGRFVDELLLFSRPLAPVRERAQVRPVLLAAVEAVRWSMADHAPWVEIRCSEGLDVQVGEDHLRQVVFNLVSNAAAAAGEGGHVVVEARPLAGGRVIRVKDDGAGVAPADRDQLFVPFFTRRPGGTGLGLSIVKRLVDLYGGAVTVRGEPGGGAIFEVSFPMPHEEEEEEEEDEARGTHPGG